MLDPVRLKMVRGLLEGSSLHATSDGDWLCKNAFTSVLIALSFSHDSCLIISPCAPKWA